MLGTLRRWLRQAAEVPSELVITMAKNWIAGAIKRPGKLHRDLGVPQGEKIPPAKIEAAAKGSGKVAQRARLAKTLKGFEGGGAVRDYGK